VVIHDAKGLLKAAPTLADQWSEILFTGGLQFLRKVIKIYPIIFKILSRLMGEVVVLL